MTLSLRRSPDRRKLEITMAQNTPERLQTEDFVIRAWTEFDGPAHWSAVQASRDHLRNMPWARDFTAPSVAENYVRRSRAQYLLRSDFDLGIWAPDESAVLGGTGFHLRGAGFEPAKQAEIGMWIRSDAAGQGLGSAVLGALLRWGFDDWGFMRLSWRCNTENRASARCAQKAGLLHEGTLRGEYDPASQSRRDTDCYGLSLLDYRARQRPA